MLKSSLSVVFLGLISHTLLASGALETKSRQKREAVDEDALTCADDYAATTVCVACADLPQGMELPLEACCQSDFVQMMCAACLMDVEKCARETVNVKLDELASLKSELDEEDAEDTGLSKRFGRLFMGAGPYGYRFNNRDSKRYGQLFMSSPYYRAPNSYKEKRFGTLFMGSPADHTNQGRDKRYGTLFMRKRFGRLFLNSGYNSWRDEKRSRESELPIDLSEESRRKRFGRLFLSNRQRNGNADKKNV